MFYILSDSCTSVNEASTSHSCTSVNEASTSTCTRHRQNKKEVTCKYFSDMW